MKIINTKIDGLVIIEPTFFEDERGYFMESFKTSWFNEKFSHINFVQENESKSDFGVLRGLHYQIPPYAQTKLVRVIKGKVLDVAIDIRKESSTFGQHISIELSSENKKQLLIPRGFAHGFIVLSSEAIFSYKVDNYYNSNAERGILYNDKQLSIDWILNSDEILISEKDKGHPLFNRAELFYNSTNLYD